MNYWPQTLTAAETKQSKAMKMPSQEKPSEKGSPLQPSLPPLIKGWAASNNQQQKTCSQSCQLFSVLRTLETNSFSMYCASTAKLRKKNTLENRRKAQSRVQSHIYSARHIYTTQEYIILLWLLQEVKYIRGWEQKTKLFFLFTSLSTGLVCT